MSTWKEVWLDNYFGRSDAAKDIDKLMKSNYKGHKYVPWAVMQKWLYLQDEDADIEILSNGGTSYDVPTIVHNHITKVYQSVDGKTTDLYKNSFYVVVKVTFMGKVFTEHYPIQDNAYNAPNYIDSNMLNKAVQRAKAKIISTATGLGYSLYEFGDLQFEDDVDVNKNKVIIKGKSKTPHVKEEVVVPNESPNENVEIDVGDNGKLELDLAKYMIDNKDTIKPVIQRINPTMVKKYNKSINLDADIKDIVEVLKLVDNITLFGNSIKKQHGDLLNG